MLEHENLTERIIGAAMEVHRKHRLLLYFAATTLQIKRVIAN